MKDYIEKHGTFDKVDRNLKQKGYYRFPKFLQETCKDWEHVWVPPNPGDPGSCIGAVLAQTQTKITLDKQWYKAI